MRNVISVQLLSLFLALLLLSAGLVQGKSSAVHATRSRQLSTQYSPADSTVLHLLHLQARPPRAPAPPHLVGCSMLGYFPSPLSVPTLPFPTRESSLPTP